MSVTLDERLFARLVGRYPDTDMMLFQVSEGIAAPVIDEWSPLVRFRFVRREGGMVEMEVATVFDPAETT